MHRYVRHVMDFSYIYIFFNFHLFLKINSIQSVVALSKTDIRRLNVSYIRIVCQVYFFFMYLFC